MYNIFKDVLNEIEKNLIHSDYDIGNQQNLKS